MKDAEQNNSVELLEKAAETCFQSIKEALKMQEQFADKWFKTVKEASGKEDWGKQLEEAAAKVNEQAKSNLEEAMKVIEEGARDGMALFNKAVAIGGVSTPGEAQVKLQQLWQESATLMSDNAKALMKSNSKMLEVWGQMAKENVEKATAKS